MTPSITAHYFMLSVVMLSVSII